MVYLAYISILLMAVQLINSFINFVFRQRLECEGEGDINCVSVLIPVRNEEKNINLILEDLIRINDSILEILVFDDQSTDNTANEVLEQAKKDPRIRLIQSKGLPQGWLGKNHACYQLAKEASGSQYLFIDADVRINGKIICDAALYLKKNNLALLSIFPVQILKTFGEKISVPIMNYILITLLPLIFVRMSPFKSHAVANGQFMLFNAETYKNIQPHLLFKDSLVEDIAIARFLKKQKSTIACLTGDNRINCRMYKSYNDAVNGFTKNIYMFFGNSIAMAILFWLLASVGFIPVLIVLPGYFLWYIIGVLAIQVLYSSVSKQKSIQNVILFPFQLAFLVQVLANALLVRAKKNYSWKERNVFS